MHLHKPLPSPHPPRLCPHLLLSFLLFFENPTVCHKLASFSFLPPLGRLPALQRLYEGCLATSQQKCSLLCVVAVEGLKAFQVFFCLLSNAVYVGDVTFSLGWLRWSKVCLSASASICWVTVTQHTPVCVWERECVSVPLWAFCTLSL